LIPTQIKKEKRLSKERIKELAERRTSWGVQELMKGKEVQQPPLQDLAKIQEELNKSSWVEDKKTYTKFGDRVRRASLLNQGVGAIKERRGSRPEDKERRDSFFWGDVEDDPDVAKLLLTKGRAPGMRWDKAVSVLGIGLLAVNNNQHDKEAVRLTDTIEEAEEKLEEAYNQRKEEASTEAEQGEMREAYQCLITVLQAKKRFKSKARKVSV